MPEAIGKEVVLSVTQWSSKFHTQVPDSLVKWFTKILAVKSLHSAIRVTILECISVIFNNNTYQQVLGSNNYN